jgi:hypothetical protein
MIAEREERFKGKKVLAVAKNRRCGSRFKVDPG